MSETGSEVGGALGLSLLGTIGLAIYRSQMTTDLPAGVPDADAATARDTLGAALEVAAALPAEVGAAVARVAQDAFVDGMQVAAFISVALSVVVAVVAFLGLRHIPPTNAQPLGAAHAGDEAATSPKATITPAPESSA
jgi:DHA2 family multidrug resistance protein-like MFS transporter